MIRAMMERADKIVTTTTRYLEWLVKIMEGLEAKYPNSPQLEFRRGQLHATSRCPDSDCGDYCEVGYQLGTNVVQATIKRGEVLQNSLV
jgi:hypothetical protein